MIEKMGVAKSAEPFVCGGSAATFASVIIHPMDLAKVRNHRCFIVIIVLDSSPQNMHSSENISSGKIFISPLIYVCLLTNEMI